LDPETATYDDFEELEHSFVWVNDPRKSYRRRLPKRYWLDLVSLCSLAQVLCSMSALTFANL
jgi:hypothetical protein